ncbi:MAG: AI-2E family transporter [Anaerolineae bacterium]|nr:AI-2E family transporter [Anaerolineae bacterium]
MNQTTRQQPEPGGRMWSRNARYLALAVTVGVLLAVLYAARDLLGPLFISAFLAYLLNPIVTALSRRSRLPRKVVTTLIYLVILGLFVLLALTLAPTIVEQVRKLSVEAQTIGENLETFLAQRVVVFGFTLQPAQILGEPGDVSDLFIRSDRVVRVFQTATTNFVWVLVILVTTFYLLQDWMRLREWLFQLAPEWAESDMRRLYAEVKRIWQNYLRGQLLLMFVVGLITWIALEAIGLPGAGAIGLLTGLVDIIPTLGPILAMVVAVLVALSDGSSFLPLSNLWIALLTVAIYALIQGIENVWLRPQVMSSRLQIHPAVVFVGVAAAVYLLGVFGALVIVPVLGTLAIIGSYLRCRILQLDPWPEVKRVIEPMEAEGTNG